MIVRLKGGGQIVLTECHWVPGAYLSAGNLRGCSASSTAPSSRDRCMGVILKPDELDQLAAELARIRATIAERDAAKQSRKQRRAA